MSSTAGILNRVYISHALSTWNSRTFEFGAVLFLARIFPGTLFYASFYALVRAALTALLSSSVGRLIDGWDRLRCVRASIIWQRIPVALSCLAFMALYLPRYGDTPWVSWGLFGFTTVLACVEKLAAVANTVSIERDWVIVVSDELSVGREDLNAVMRRIDLLAKLLAPVFVSVIDEYSTFTAILVVFAQNILSVTIEYFAIAQVYQAVTGLSTRVHSGNVAVVDETTPLAAGQPADAHAGATDTSPVPPTGPSSGSGTLTRLIQPWVEYFRNTAFLASLSLSILYFTVLSTGVQMQAYLFTLGFRSIDVSMMRFAAVIVELTATWAAPFLMRKIGPVRGALWFINEQLACVCLATALFLNASGDPKTAGYSLIGGVTFSRLGLWGFDLCVQYLIQEETSESTRGSFSSTEMALQNVFELLSYGTTVVFARPEQFKYPVMISTGAVAVSACLFAAFVRKRRGHLFHTPQCFEGDKYELLTTEEQANRGSPVASSEEQPWGNRWTIGTHGSHHYGVASPSVYVD